MPAIVLLVAFVASGIAAALVTWRLSSAAPRDMLGSRDPFARGKA